MLKTILDATIAKVRQRASEGDCPITPAYSVEHLETALLTLAEAHPSPATADKLREMLEVLRADEGASVTILCDDPEANSVDVAMAVECRDDWTDWNERRFYGRDILDCLTKAVVARDAVLKAGGR